jgi:hypothetical protein
MKVAKWSSLIAFFLLLGLTACTNGTDDPLTTGDDISNGLSNQGDWRVSYFFDKDKVETHKFSGYTFQFKADGKFEAYQNDNLIRTGTWQVRAGSNSTQRLVIEVGLGKPLEELNDDWIIISMTNSKIELKDDNREHLEELHFEVI